MKIEFVGNDLLATLQDPHNAHRSFTVFSCKIDVFLPVRCFIINTISYKTAHCYVLLYYKSVLSNLLRGLSMLFFGLTKCVRKYRFRHYNRLFERMSAL